MPAVGIPSVAPPTPRGSVRRSVVGVVVTALAATLLAFVPAREAEAAPVLLSQGKPVTASSQEHGGTPAAAAVDGNAGTRWSSAHFDPQWIRVDLGATTRVSQVVLDWEAAYGKGYRIELSTNGSDWSTAHQTTTGDGGTDTIALTGEARYVRVYGTARATPYGYSLWEFKVYGESGTGGPQLPGGGDLGPNVHVFDPSTPGIQAKVDAVFRQQESAQFGSGRHAFLFKPGTYHGLNAQIGFYTQIAGLGLRPGDTTINGDVTVDAGWFHGNATQNFWRAAENLALNPVSGTNRWAVSQAASFRRMHVKGGLNLAPAGYGWASGGYIADTKVDGQIGNYSQQQWYTRDSAIGGWSNSVWNQVFSGVEGAPATSFPEPRYTTLATTPISREKPFLHLDGGEYKVFAPAKRTDARGTSWANGAPQGESIPLSRFYVVKPGATAATMNAALEQGLHLLFTPGVYHVDRTVNVNRANTIVLGLGLATIIPDNGVTAMKVADVDGVRLAGFLIDAGPVNSPTLLEIGPQGAAADHAANPTTVQDVYIRIGGAGPGKATTSMVVNSDDTIIDHTWVWRADHGEGVGWETNRADHGVRVNGDDVLATGLFVEHFNKYDVEWYGERGRTIFYQNEKAYDAPDQAAIQNGTTKGYAAYRVDDSVDTHEAWGLGSYCNYNVDPTIRQDHGFKTPVKPGVKFHSLLVVSLGGMGHYHHVINETGASTVPAGTSTVPSTLVSFP
ncbi:MULTISPECIES: discoidin domain-containing protein [Streptomyces]|uniref:Coagulation factor 5/8 type domain-containing protein n=2 Tax=Streptomyces TaxID=1883 RepID=A0A117IX33_9ACTN|nr:MULTISPECIES: discoidin domain-containing protein [Streptomyces]KUH40191.1 coagulation factor 5/8 type domain-containing protein [Streptomyces kanasensis]UUS34173.1 discoidin domain-containing protein [Streptomyces changanensis]